MSYKIALFAFPETVATDAILNWVRSTINVLRMDFDLGEVVVPFHTTGNLKFCQLLADGASGRRFMRGTATDGLLYLDFESAFLGYDDQNGVYLFESFSPEENQNLFLLSDGCKVGGSVDALTVDYPQKGYSHEALDALFDKTESELSEAEFHAIAEWKGAIDIGLAERFAWTSGRAFLDICHVDKVTKLNGEEVPRPANAQPLFAFAPEDSDFRYADVPRRFY